MKNLHLQESLKQLEQIDAKCPDIRATLSIVMTGKGDAFLITSCNKDVSKVELYGTMHLLAGRLLDAEPQPPLAVAPANNDIPSEEKVMQ